MDLNKELKQEINGIDEKYGLSKLLSNYGRLFPVGSYVYDLMAWKDYDLVLEVDLLNENFVSELINKIKLNLKTSELKALNNLNKENKNRPQGYWVGIYVDTWKIDLWLMDKTNSEIEREQSEKLRNMLKDVNKQELITLKSELAKDSDYHVKFSSVDLYNAFVNGNVRTVKDFFIWLGDRP